jgi:Zn-dependent protease with chaperone function
VSRRFGPTTLALLAPLLVFVLFGMTRVVAPVSALGLVFDEPAEFAVAAAVSSLAGAVLLFVRPVERALARVLAGPVRPPAAPERERLDRLLERAAAQAGLDPARLIVRIQEEPGVNAAAGAGHLLFVTTGALELPDEQLEAVLAHELGHHRGFHPIVGALVWWLRLPGVAVAAVYGALRRAVSALGERLGTIGRLLAIPLLVLLVIWQIAVMWIFYVGELLAKWAARRSEYDADASAARWGYAAQLAAAYQALSAHGLEPSGRLARLMADHPPLPDRIGLLEVAQRPAVGAHP